MKQKLKTHKSLKKRVKITSKGKLISSHAYKSHLLEKKSSARKRRLRKRAPIDPSAASIFRRLLPYR